MRQLLDKRIIKSPVAGAGTLKITPRPSKSSKWQLRGNGESLSIPVVPVFIDFLMELFVLGLVLVSILLVEQRDWSFFWDISLYRPFLICAIISCSAFCRHTTSDLHTSRCVTLDSQVGVQGIKKQLNNQCMNIITEYSRQIKISYTNINISV